MKKIEELKSLRNKLIVYGDTLNLPEYVTFGLEVEIENIELSKIGKIVEDLKTTDSSFDGYKSHLDTSIMSIYKRTLINGEISTSILRDKKEDWENFSKILNKLIENNAIITNQCSSHVNIGAHILGDNELYWKNFLLLWKLYEEEIIHLDTSHNRSDSTWSCCRKLCGNSPQKGEKSQIYLPFYW